MSHAAQRPLRARTGLVLLLAALSAAAIWALLAGAFPLPAREVLALGGLVTSQDSIAQAVLLDLRLPRLTAAVLVGGGLAISGCVFQALLRNPLADPSFIGVSSGAAVAAALAITVATILPPTLVPAPQYLLPIAALAGGLLAAALALRLASVASETPTLTLLLAGLAINALAGGLLGLIAYSASDSALRVITLWLFGSLARADWPALAVAAPCMLIASLLLWRRSRALNVLLLGEAEAGHIGVDVDRLKRGGLILAVVCAAFAVAVAGVIGFIGLMVPHILRLLLGPDHRALLPLSFLGGAALLTVADTISRVAFAPTELPVGIVTALLGAPFFLVLLLRWRHGVDPG